MSSRYNSSRRSGRYGGYDAPVLPRSFLPLLATHPKEKVEDEEEEVRQRRSRTYPAFDPAEWRLQRCQRRLATMDVDAAFDRARDRIRRSTQRWTDRYEESKEKLAKIGGSKAEEDFCKNLSKTTFNHYDVTASRKEEQKMDEKVYEAVGISDNIVLTHSTNDATENVAAEEVCKVAAADQVPCVNELNPPVVRDDQVSSAAPAADEPKDQSPEEAIEDEEEYTWTSCSETSEVEEIKTDVVVTEEEKKVINMHPPTPKSPPLTNGHSMESLNQGNQGSRPQSEKEMSRKNSCTFSPFACRQEVKLRSTFKSLMTMKKDLSWLDKNENLAMDSMHTTLEKWLESTRQWQSDGFEGSRGRAPSGSTPKVGTRPTDPYHRLRDEVYSYRGERNSFGKPHGKGVVTYENGDQFTGEFEDEMREGRGTLRPLGGDMVYLDGHYINDQLEGKGKIEYRNGDILHAWFSGGTLHGLGKLFDRENKLKRIGWHDSGKLTGTVWYFLTGGGCLVGETDYTGALIGDNIAFLFPDHQTVLVGTFVRTQMLMAQTCFILSVTVRNELCHLRFTQPRGPIYSYDPGKNDVICQDPLLPDPYESQYCYVRQSRIRGAKEGLFAKRDLPADFVVCFYNGVRLRAEEIEKDREEWEANAYKIIDLLGPDEEGNEGVLDIPAKFVATKNYTASLAHKANHSFQPNGRFILFEHPRFGKVPAIVTIAPVEKDMEVTVSYDYALDEAPPWYQDLFAKRILDQYRESRTWNF